MATGPQQKRKELREKRLKAEAAAKGGERRQGMAKIIGVAAFLAVIAIAVVSAAALFRFRLNSTWLILAGAILGLLWKA